MQDCPWWLNNTNEVYQSLLPFFFEFGIHYVTVVFAEMLLGSCTCDKEKKCRSAAWERKNEKFSCESALHTCSATWQVISPSLPPPSYGPAYSHSKILCTSGQRMWTKPLFFCTGLCLLDTRPGGNGPVHLWKINMNHKVTADPTYAWTLVRQQGLIALLLWLCSWWNLCWQWNWVL